MTYVRVSDGSKILCPRSVHGPVHEAHQLHTRVLDAFYKSGERDADGELIEPLAKPYQAASSGDASSWMELFHHLVFALHEGDAATVESWWWQCRTCGLILPAQRIVR